MTVNRLHLKLLAAIVATLAALAMHQYLPKKKQMIWPATDIPTYFNAGTLHDGTSAAKWVNEAEHRWECTYPEKQDGFFPCSFSLILNNADMQGRNFSGYRKLRLKLDFEGTVDVVQISIRNFNSVYSKAADPNSSKFMALYLLPEELNGELIIDLDKFTVAHWWMAQYHMPLSFVHSEMDNITSLTIDPQSAHTKIVGKQQLALHEVELIGDWVDAKNWYLGILLLWLGGISVWIFSEFIRLRRKNIKDAAAISELADSNQQLKVETDKFRRLSTIDSLTQTYNRFGIDQIVSDLLGSAKTGERNIVPVFVLILIDIDHFKRVNDTRGHNIGDTVLQNVSKIICGTVRPQDYVGRWGGEEFLVIQPYTSARDTFATAEKVREAIAAFVFEPHKPLVVTASFGVSEFTAGDDFASCFQRADAALYSAKNAGRNCCVLAA